MKTQVISPHELDDMKAFDQERVFEYFTVKNGKAKYHILHLANNSCGLYYALRVLPDGSLGARRAVEPTDILVAHFKTR